MNSNENLSRLTVRICSPVIELPDNFQVSVLREGSIWNLKQALAASTYVEPLQPTDLHLIYQGKILSDEQPLAATFKVNQLTKYLSYGIILMDDILIYY
jgi:hypothetical protein